MNPVVHYLDMVSEMQAALLVKNGVKFKYSGIEDLYFKSGHLFSQEPLSVADMFDLGELLRGVVRYRFRPRECFMNAAKLAFDVNGLVYCEGFAWCGIIPVQHAWVSFRGRPIDVTWPKKDDGELAQGRIDKVTVSLKKILSRVAYNIGACSYYGIEVANNYLREHILATEKYSPYVEGKDYSFKPVREGLPWR